jgi:DNA repair protein RecN (Recombination protein N)
VHLDELVSHDERAATLDAELTAARADERRRAVEVGAARRAAAPGLAAAVTAHLADLAMPRARVEVRVDGLAGDEVVFLLAANAGEPALPLAKVASGGELARAMLALRLVTTHAPPTLVFDEVDAGIGGQAALSIGRALRALGTSHQVLVVTHLAQVAAHADDHWVVTKHEAAGRTVSRARRLAPPDRLEEISRMLSGMGDSPTGRRHAKDLLAAARRTEG